MMSWRWKSTVLGLMPSARAASLLVEPSAISRRISIWRGVNAVLHKIRSGCAVLRAEPACDLAREMEHKMRHQTLAAADLDALAGALRDLAIDLLRFVTDTRGEQTPNLALAA